MWFRVDDKLHTHEKALLAGVPAMGLWVMCGSWCASHEKRRLRSHPRRRRAASLVAANCGDQ